MPVSSSTPQAILEPADGPRAVVVTVHGTWPGEASWATADSTLARALQRWFAGRGCLAVVEPFRWSGRNSINARRTAGAELAEFLDQICRDDPSAALYVIAHSHGGSVFAYAMKLRPELVGKIDGFIALATPWLGLEPCSYSAALRLLLGKLKLYVAFVAALFILPSIVQLVLLLTTKRPELPEHVPGEPITIIDLPVDPLFVWAPILSAAAIGLILFFPLQRLVSRRLEDGMTAFHQKLSNIAQDSSTLFEQLPPSVFLKPIGDEAALALTLTSAINAFAQVISTLIFVSLQWVRDRWMSAPGTLRIVCGLLFIALWSVGTMQLEEPVLKMYHELRMTPIQDMR